jgi:uncharacterized membrane protein
VREEAAGTPLFYRGDPGDAMYLIETGRVRISVKDADGHDATLADLHDGEFFGEMAILDEQPRSADATIIANTRLAVLSRNDFRAFLHKNPDIALGILTAMIHRLRRTDELLRHRVSRNVNEEEAARLTFADRMADMIAEFGGSWKFIIVSLSLFVIWVLLNTLLLTRKPFDPFPFILLNLALNMITALQAPIIMMSQNRQGLKDRLRADLDYRVNLKNELLLSEVMQRLSAIESAVHAKMPEYVESDRTD